MKSLIKITAVAILLSFTGQAKAQFLKKLQKKIENKIERRLEKKADDKADQALDSVFENKSSKGKKDKRKKKASSKNNNANENTGGFDLGGMMEAAMNRKPAEIEPSYTFTFTTTMEMTTSQSKPMVMTTSYGDGAHYIKMDTGMTIINDFKNESMITINEKKKTAQAMSSSFMKMLENSDVNEDPGDTPEITVKKTGKTKNVSGYRCDEYSITGEDFNTTGWFTQEVNFDMMEHAKSMSETFKDATSQMIINQNIGFPMEMTTIANKNNTVTMKVLDISEEAKTVAMSDYKVSKL